MCNKDRKYSLLSRLQRPFVHVRQDDRVWGSVYVPERFAGMHCYVISRKGAAKLLRLLPRVQDHIDVCMNHPDVRVYAVSNDLAYQRDMSDSSIASFSFPKTLLPLLECIKDDKGISLAYLLNSPGGQVAGMHINLWTPALVFLGLIGGTRLAPYLAAFMLVEVALGGDIRMPVIAYGAGWALRALLAMAVYRMFRR